MSRAALRLGWLLCGAAAVCVATPAAPRDDGAADSRLSLAKSRCIQLAELVSCDAALSMKPNDPGLLLAEADALVRGKRPGEAIGVYRNALRSGASASLVNARIAAAESQRRRFVAACAAERGDLGVHACEAAWLPGAPDEVKTFKRRGLLLQQDGRFAAALEAYMAAARLGARDRDVAGAIVNLSGRSAAGNAAVLTARGDALMTLGRPAEAIAALREALRLAPDLAEARSHLQMAQHVMAKQPERTVAKSAPPAAKAAPSAAMPEYTNQAPAGRSN